LIAWNKIDRVSVSFDRMNCAIKKEGHPMFKKWLLTLLLIGVFATPTLAQDATRIASPIQRLLPQVTTVTLVQNGDSFELVITGTLPDGCDLTNTIHTEQIGTTWFIDIYRELPFNTVCPAILKSYEERLDAAWLIAQPADAPLINVIVINGAIFGIDYPNDAPPSISTLWVRGNLLYDTLSTRITPEGMVEITLVGNLNDGCHVPVYRAVPDWQNEGFTTIEAYSALSIAFMCAQALVPYEVTFTTPLFTSIAVNGVGVPFNPAISSDVQTFTEQAVPVTSATAEWVEGVLPNLKINVSGTTDGCEFPIQIVPQTPMENTYLIKVVRVLPINTACIEIARTYKEELYFSPVLMSDLPLTLIIGDQVITVPAL